MAKVNRSGKTHNQRMKSRFLSIIGVVCAVILVFIFRQPLLKACTHQDKVGEQGPAVRTPNVIIPDGTPSFEKNYTGFYVDFNPEQHVPNYVFWELTSGKVAGTIKRKSEFHQDILVPGCPGLDDYRRSGLSRGHMAPAADMKWDETAMFDSHSLANICPQDVSVNNGIWGSIESMCRRWARTDSLILIVAGPVLSDSITRRIGSSGVSVPERFFKVVLAPDADPPRAIAFMVPNTPGQYRVEDCVVSVDEVEAATGFDFFPWLPDEIENLIESESKLSLWNRSRKF